MSELPARLPIAALERIDAACQEFESEWKSGRRPEIAAFIQDVSGTERAALVSELVMLEVDYRRRAGEVPDQSEYLSTFQCLDSTVFDRAVTAGGRSPAAPPTAPSERPPAADLDPGTRVGGYEIESLLGRGGMGAVYRAEHRHLRRPVALKLQERSGSHDDELVHRFRQESELVARLSHPRIVAAHDAGEHEGRLFLVTELVEGRDLASEVREDGPLSFEDALACIRDAAEGLAYAHSQGIIHRDVKPSNLLRGPDGRIKVADLGLARWRKVDPPLSGVAPSSTSPGTAMGTIDYLSPEQARDATDVDERSDVYSLGCTLYFLLTGRPMFAGEPLDRVVSHLTHAAPDLREHCPEIGGFGRELFRRMVAKSPDDRFPTMTALLESIENRCVSPAAVETPAGRRRPTRRVLVALGLGLCASVIAATSQWRGPGEKTTRSAAKQSLAASAPLVVEDSAAAEGGPTLPVVPFGSPETVQRQWADHLGVDVAVTEAGIDFVFIPPGRFLMGSSEEQVAYLRSLGSGITNETKSEEPQHEETIEAPFYLGKTEVTVDQFARFVEATGYLTTVEADRNRERSGRPLLRGYGRTDGKWKRGGDFDWRDLGEIDVTGDMPVMNVTYDDATAFVRWLTGEDDGPRYRLPTQREWEYAARSGTDTLWYHGSERPRTGAFSWVNINSDSRPHPVATKPANGFGLHDMYGNVNEFCLDQFEHVDGRQVPIEIGDLEGSHRNIKVSARGGHFLDRVDARSTARTYQPRESVNFHGFRVLRQIAP